MSGMFLGHSVYHWPSELRIGTSVIPALENVHVNFVFFSCFVFELGFRTEQAEKRMGTR